MFEKIKRVYTQSAIILFNTVLLFCLIDLVCAVAIRIRQGPPSTHNPIVAYGKARVLQGYRDRPEADAIAMLHETWDEMDPRSEYDEMAQFKEAPFHGRFVNVDPAGFRVSHPAGPWPPDPANFNIFVFGGSTTFGYGVSDAETLPSALERLLAKQSARPVFAYNFGHGSHFSTQELMSYYALLTSGRAPNVAIFVDGVNDLGHLSGKLDNTDYLTSLVRQDNYGSSYGPTLFAIASRTSIARAAIWLRKKVEHRPAQSPPPDRHDAAALAKVRDRWLTNKMLAETLSARFHVRPLFVWQPAPTYHYDYERYHILRGLGPGPFRWSADILDGYPLMERSRAELEKGKDFLWLADLQQDRRENLYVDEFHYTAAFTNDIAAQIIGFIQANGYFAAADPPRN